MIRFLKKFTSGPAEFIQKLNDIVDIVNILQKISGDTFIKINNNSAGVNFGLDFNTLKARLGVIGGGGGSGSEIRRAKLTASAGEGNTITANLYDSSGVEQTTGDEAGITVYCNINAQTGESGIHLFSCIPRLYEGQDVLVALVPVKIPDPNHYGDYLLDMRWYCTAIFQLIAAGQDDFFMVDAESGILDIDLAKCEEE